MMTLDRIEYFPNPDRYVTLSPSAKQASKQASIQAFKQASNQSHRTFVHSCHYSSRGNTNITRHGPCFQVSNPCAHALLRCMIHRIVRLAGGDASSVHADRPPNRADPVNRGVVSRGIRAETVKKNLLDSSITSVSADSHAMIIFFYNLLLHVSAG